MKRHTCKHGEFQQSILNIQKNLIASKLLYAKYRNILPLIYFYGFARFVCPKSENNKIKKCLSKTVFMRLPLHIIKYM